MRVIIVDTNGDLAFTSIALERTIIPLALPNGADEKTYEEMQSEYEAQQTWMDLLTTQFDANRRTQYIDAGPHRLSRVEATANGYAFLTDVSRNPSDEFFRHGSYLIEFDERGETNRIYLEPIVEQLGVKPVTFAATADGSFYLHAIDQSTGDSHIILIDHDGNPLARGHTTNGGSATIEGMQTDGSGVWLYGLEYRNKDKAKLWMERISFASILSL